MATNASGSAPHGHGVIFVNPAAGDDEGGLDDIREAFSGHRVQECEPGDLTNEVSRAKDGDLRFIGVAGGDGTIRSVAQLLVGGDMPLLAVPAGTRNHFARELELVDFPAAARAAGGPLVRVDVGEVNGHVFVNNSAVGAYPALVEHRDGLQRRGLSKRVAQLVATWRLVRKGHRFDVRVDGTSYRAWAIFVGNGHYGEGLFSVSARDSMVAGELDFRLLRADRTLARTRICFALLAGRLQASPLFVGQRCQEVAVDVGNREVPVALDGEVERLQSPLHYRTRPRSLPVLVQPYEDDELPTALRP